MELTSTTGFDFKLIHKQKMETTSENDQQVNGDFSILHNGNTVGLLTVTSFYDRSQVSMEVPEVNFSISEWLSLLNLVKQVFQLKDTQSIMLNKYPQSFEMCV